MMLTVIASPTLAVEVDFSATIMIPEPDGKAEYVAPRDIRAPSPADKVLPAKTYTSSGVPDRKVMDFSVAAASIVLV